MINAFLELNADDEGAAAVGSTESTLKPTPYKHPKHPLTVLWDLPGAGTLNFPVDSYLRRIDVNKYDCFLLITATRFSEATLKVAKGN